MVMCAVMLVVFTMIVIDVWCWKVMVLALVLWLLLLQGKLAREVQDLEY